MTQVTDEMVRVFSSAVSGGSIKDGFQALFDAKLISLPVDEAAIRESVVRECIAALPKAYLQNPHTHCGQAVRESHEAAEKALQSLLPTERAEELVARYIASDSSDHEPGILIDPVKFARWLIEREGV